MNLLSVDLAQSAWYGPIRDFNPRGVAWFSVINPWLAEIYKLKFNPDNNKKEQGIKFQDGEFIFKEGELPISITLSIFSGALIVDTRHSTEVADAFLIDLLTKLSNDFGIKSYSEIIREKKYYSQLWVSTDKSLNILNPKLEEINAYLSKHVEHEDPLSFEVGGLSCWPDQKSKFSPPAFLLERAAGIPFSDNRYLSRAPLKTDQHLELLNMLEDILS